MPRANPQNANLALKMAIFASGRAQQDIARAVSFMNI